MPNSVTLTIPEDLPLIGAGLLSAILLLTYQTIVVSKARTAAKIPYPRLVYAEKAEQDASIEALIFNCTQRAHQNTLESLPIVLITTVLGSIKHAKITAALLGVWVISRVLYTRGYRTGDPQKRGIGAFPGTTSVLALIGVAGTVVVQSLRTYFGL